MAKRQMRATAKPPDLRRLSVGGDDDVAGFQLIQSAMRALGCGDEPAAVEVGKRACRRKAVGYRKQQNVLGQRHGSAVRHHVVQV